MLRGKNQMVIPVAWTGIAATLLKGATTVHSMFQIPLSLDETSTSSLKLNTKKAKMIANCKLILWDEAPMAPFMR